MFSPVLSSTTNKETIESKLNYCGLFFKTGTTKEDLLNVFSNDNNTSFKINLNIEITQMLFENDENLDFDYRQQKYINWMRKGLKHIILYNLFTKDYLIVKEAILLQSSLSREYKEGILNEDKGLLNSFSQSSRIFRMIGHTHLIKDYMSNEDKENIINGMRREVEFLNNNILEKYDQMISDIFELDNLFDSYEED